MWRALVLGLALISGCDLPDADPRAGETPPAWRDARNDGSETGDDDGNTTRQPADYDDATGFSETGSDDDTAGDDDMGDTGDEPLPDPAPGNAVCGPTHLNWFVGFPIEMPHRPCSAGLPCRPPPLCSPPPDR